MKRILIHSAPPWAPSGYGLQCRYLAEALRYLRYEVAISVFGGCHENRTWHGFPIMSTGTRPYGNGVIAGNYKAWNADLCIYLGDFWVLEPGQLQGLNFMPWLPIDTEPLSVMDKQRLDQLRGPNLHPVAMSEFGQRMLRNAGIDAPVLPHATPFKPDPDAGRRWREMQRVPEQLFMISKVGVNNVDDRKAFDITLQAFAEFASGRDDVGLYLHTEAQPAKCMNLAYMAIELGIASKRGSKVVFADEHRRAVDGFDSDWMHGMFCATDVLDATSRAEGFGVPAIEALACGTPVIGSDNSAMPEKIDPSYGWLVTGQRQRASHHQAWWQTPSVDDLTECYEEAYGKAGKMRAAAARAGELWTPRLMQARLKEILESIEQGTDHQKVFTEIYGKGVWGGNNSGPGSDPEQAAEYVEFVSDYILDHGITSVLDLGCGDGRIAAAIDLNGASYTGLDVVKGDDIRTCELPPAELALVKDVFQHWPNRDIQEMWTRLLPYPHVLITNTLTEEVNGSPTNLDIEAGHWRGVDLAAAPFSWPVEELLRWERNGETKTTVRLQWT